MKRMLRNVLCLSVVLSLTAKADVTLLEDDFSSVTLTNTGNVLRDDAGLWRVNQTSNTTITNETLTASGTGTTGEGACGQIIPLSGLALTDENALSLTFDYSTEHAGETIYVHLWGYKENAVPSATNTVTMNTGAQNGNAWEKSEEVMDCYNLGKAQGIFTSTPGILSDAADIITGSGSYSNVFKLLSYTNANNMVALYDYVVIGFARNQSTAGAGLTTLDNVKLTAVTASASAEIDPAELMMELVTPATMATGTVDFIYSSATNMDLTISVSNESHPGAFAASSPAQTLPDSVTELAFTFDNSVANLAVNESATGLVTLAWAETGGGAGGTILMPISASMLPSAAQPSLSIPASTTDYVRGGTRGGQAQNGLEEIAFKGLTDSNLTRFGMLRFALTDEQKTQMLAAPTVTLDMFFKKGNAATGPDTTIKVYGLADNTDVGAGTAETTWDTSVTWNSRPDGDSNLANTNTTFIGDTLVAGQAPVNVVISLTLGKAALDALIAADTNNEITFLLGDTTASASLFFASLTNTEGFPVPTLSVFPPPGYQEWIGNFGLSGDDLLPETDVEPDGLDNLMEYALGGNPTNDDAAVVSPKTYTAHEGGTDWFYHVSNQRTFDPSLTFTLGTETMLTGTTSWDTNDIFFVGESVATNNYKSVTNRTEASSSAKFIELDVQQN